MSKQDIKTEHVDSDATIRSGLDALGEWSDPEGKLAEVVHLVESPRVDEGVIDSTFARLPQVVVEAAMQSHQRYFPIGRARFGFVANGGDPQTVREGNERILRGRLDDAMFAYDHDASVGLEAMASSLDTVVFMAGGGSFADKARRLAALVEELGGDELSVEAARLAKADQASALVREFPELEGLIGAAYAEAAGEPPEVVAAIAEHYLPEGQDAPLPSSRRGAILSVADKIDNLRVAFALGRRPRGSSDPFALRRAAIGLCRLALEGEVSIPIALLGEELSAFVLERLEGLLDVPVEFVRAARRSAVQEIQAVGRLALALAALPAERLDELLSADARVTHITDREAAGLAEDARPVADLLLEAEERRLYEAIETHGPILERAIAGGDASVALDAALSLVEPVPSFFDAVLILDENRALAENRLALLRCLRSRLRLLGALDSLPR
jgi:glycyl-tRNA synthetase beta chain